MKKLAMLLFVFAFVLAACGTAATATPAVSATTVPLNAVIAEGHLVPARDATMAFQARGTVTEVDVQIGDTVKAGDVLARLGGPGDAAYTSARLGLVDAQQSYDAYVRNLPLSIAQAWQTYMKAQKTRADALFAWNNLDVKDIESRLKDQQTIVNDRQSDLEKAQAEFDTFKDRPEEDFERRNAQDKLTQAQEDLDEAIRKYESIQRERDNVRDALDIAIAAEKEARLNYESAAQGNDQGGAIVEQLAVLKAKLAAAQAQMDSFNVTAPFDGTVMDVNVAVGDQLGPETWAVKMADTSAWYVETSDLTELEVVKIALGLKASIVPDALPGLSMSATVDSISQAFILSGGDVQYRVKLKVDQIDPRVLWGMTVEVTFEPLP
jgi:multidrug resistance efflux pump